MAIKFTSVKCPECGGLFSIEEGRTRAFCSYCGAQITVINENEYTYRIIDEAEVKHEETERIIKFREMEMADKARLAEEKGRFKKFKVSILVGVFVMIITFVMGCLATSKEIAVLGIVCGLAIMLMGIRSK